MYILVSIRLSARLSFARRWQRSNDAHPWEYRTDDDIEGLKTFFVNRVTPYFVCLPIRSIFVLSSYDSTDFACATYYIS